MTALAPELAADAQDSGNALVHSACPCSEDVALCGADVSGQRWAEDDEELTCVVCIDLVDQPCPRCGL